MCRGKPSGWDLPGCSRFRRVAGQVCRAVGLLAALLCLADLPAQAQSAGAPGVVTYPAGPPGPEPVGPYSYPLPPGDFCCVGGEDPGPCCGIYLRAGPVFTVGGGFLEERTHTGWTVQAGLRRSLGLPRPSGEFFGEFGLGYVFNDGDDFGVPIPGWFRGQDPPDDHVHPFNVLMRVQMHRLHRYGVHAGLGRTFYPPFLFNQGPERPLRLILRGGLRVGGIEPTYSKILPPDVREAIREHLGHGHRQIEFSTPGGNDPTLHFGMYGSAGLGFTFWNARLAGISLGTVTIGGEVELARDWFNLGDYARGDHGLTTLTPMATVMFGF